MYHKVLHARQTWVSELEVEDPAALEYTSPTDSETSGKIIRDGSF
jgi:hypothetical protein